jgi:hypothetical protein
MITFFTASEKNIPSAAVQSTFSSMVLTEDKNKVKPFGTFFI